MADVPSVAAAWSIQRQGSQYVSIKYIERVAEADVAPTVAASAIPTRQVILQRRSSPSRSTDIAHA